jgi:ubiquinone/menaquinone biosynthesis C-methylase UbiE
MNHHTPVAFDNDESLSFPEMTSSSARIFDTARSDHYDEFLGFDTGGQFTPSLFDAWRDKDGHSCFRNVQCYSPQYIDIALPPKKPEAIANLYDALSTSYDDLYSGEQSEKHERIIETLKGRGFERFVDVGCGTGKLLETVLSRTTLAIGIDLSRQMLIKARRRINDRSAQFVRAEASHLPLQDRVADGVVSVSVSEHGPSFAEQFQELSRIATKNAVLSMTVFSDKNRAFHEQLIQQNMEFVGSLSDREQLWTKRPRAR